MKPSEDRISSLTSWFPIKANRGVASGDNETGIRMGTPSQLFSVDFDDSRAAVNHGPKNEIQPKLSSEDQALRQRESESTDKQKSEEPKHEVRSGRRWKPSIKVLPESLQKSISRVSRDFTLKKTSNPLFPRKVALTSPMIPAKAILPDPSLPEPMPSSSD